MKKVLLLVGAIGAFLVGYGASASWAYPSGGVDDRGEWRGYFTNILDTEGTEVLRRVYGSEAISPAVNDADSFIDFIKYTKLDIDGNGSGTAQDKTGAAFIINSMLGAGTGSRTRTPSASSISEWEERIRYLDLHGKVSWRANYSFTINSYYQGTGGGGSDPNDDAFYDETGTKPSIVFRNMSNTIVYAIKWECGNPVGTTGLPYLPPTPDWNISGGTTIQVNDGAEQYAPKVSPGDKLTFRHYLQNIGINGTGSDTISYRIYQGTTIRYTGNAGAIGFAGHPTSIKDNLGVENYVVPLSTPPGTLICRHIWWTPDTELGGSQQGIQRCAQVVANYELTPIINISVNGGAPVGAGATAEAGDSITFTYGVHNDGGTSQSTNCRTYSVVENGSYSVPTPIDASNRGDPYTSLSLGCPRTFPSGNTTLAPTDTIASVAANRTYCRAFYLNPTTYGGVMEGVESCIRIVAKPIVKVFGGDILAGSGLETAPSTCTNNTNAQILAWNRRNDDNYAGSGAQYAAMALNRIGDFASAQRAGSSAAAPAALSFASTTSNLATGNFGGTFGSVPCIKDYWATRPATPAPGSTNLSSLGTDKYGLTGNQTFNGGNINPNQRTVLYVDGNVRITGSGITYPGSWSSPASTPQFLLVVRGNIYIDPTVTTLYGNYIAQGNGSTGGVIYTCANSFAVPVLDGTFYNRCKANKLTVYGSFVANRVEFLRTNGSLKQSTSSDVAGNTNIGEEFVYSPLNWLSQPDMGGNTTAYDAITSLPPIL